MPTIMSYRTKLNYSYAVPLNKGGFRGLCFSVAIPHFHEDKLTTPLPPFLRGILYAIHRVARLNKMKILYN